MEPKFLDVKGTFKIVQSDLILLKKKWKAQASEELARVPGNLWQTHD